MPFVLLFIGAVFIIAAYRDTTSDLFALIQGDFLGKNNFLLWIGAILSVGFLGYIPAFKNFSRAFLALIIVAIFLTQTGFFERFRNQIQLNTGA